MSNKPFPIWMMSIVSCLLGVFVSIYSYSFKQGINEKTLQGLSSQITGIAHAVEERGPVIARHDTEIYALKESIKRLEAVQEVSRKENREEHMSIVQSLNKIYEKVK